MTKDFPSYHHCQYNSKQFHRVSVPKLTIVQDLTGIEQSWPDQGGGSQENWKKEATRDIPWLWYTVAESLPYENGKLCKPMWFKLGLGKMSPNLPYLRLPRWLNCRLILKATLKSHVVLPLLCHWTWDSWLFFLLWKAFLAK